MPNIKLQWWLGNQMFEYALAYSLSKQYQEPIVFDGFFLESRVLWLNWAVKPFELNVFGIEKTYSTPHIFIRKYIHPIFYYSIKKIQFWSRYIKEKNGAYIESFPERAFLDGWFQSYKYFDKYSSDITGLFTVTTPITKKNEEILSLIQNVYKNSVSLHVRRGDYVSLNSTNKWHGVCSVGYYEYAIKFFQDTLWAPVFFIFSDDIEWCKENIHFPEWVRAHYIDHNSDAWHDDMRLMYSCGHHIIANSSFSWWWAYLGRNPEKIIIAPKKWLQTDAFSTENLIPPSWIRL